MDKEMKNIEREGYMLKLPMDFVAGLIDALLSQKVTKLEHDKASGKLTITFGTGDLQSTQETTIQIPEYEVATTSKDGLMSSADKSKLDNIASNANNYSLPAATASALGGVKIGSNITNSSGTISLTKANVTGALGYTPSSTTYTHPTATAYTGKPTANQTPAFGGSFTVSQVVTNALGHVTGMTDRTVTLPAAPSPPVIINQSSPNLNELYTNSNTATFYYVENLTAGATSLTNGPSGVTMAYLIVMTWYANNYKTNMQLLIPAMINSSTEYNKIYVRLFCINKTSWDGSSNWRSATLS